MPLHIRTHKGSVSIVVLEKWDQRCRNRDYLLGRNVHEVDIAWRGAREFILMPNIDQFVSELTLCIHRRTSLRNNILRLINRREEFHFLGYRTVDDPMIGRLQESVFIGPRVGCQAVYQTNVWSFRRLNWAYPAVVRWVHITHFKSCPLAGQSTWPER